VYSWTADNPLLLKSCLSASRCIRELLTESVHVLLGCLILSSTAPLYVSLSDRTDSLLAHALLQNSDWNLKQGVRWRKDRRYLLRRSNALLQLGHMEDGVDLARTGQLQLVRHLSYTFQDTEGTEELEC
jgi:hypothetical protein